MYIYSHQIFKQSFEFLTSTNKTYINMPYTFDIDFKVSNIPIIYKPSNVKLNNAAYSNRNRRHRFNIDSPIRGFDKRDIFNENGYVK